MRFLAGGRRGTGTSGRRRPACSQQEQRGSATSPAVREPYRLNAPCFVSTRFTPNRPSAGLVVCEPPKPRLCPVSLWPGRGVPAVPTSSPRGGPAGAGVAPRVFPVRGGAAWERQGRRAGGLPPRGRALDEARAGINGFIQSGSEKHYIDPMVSNGFSIAARSGIPLSSKDGLVWAGTRPFKHCHHSGHFRRTLFCCLPPPLPCGNFPI